jgi:hypothetical protein
MEAAQSRAIALKRSLTALVALSAIAFLAVVHGAVLAGLLAIRLIRRKRDRGKCLPTSSTTRFSRNLSCANYASGMLQHQIKNGQLPDGISNGIASGVVTKKRLDFEIT